MFDDDEPVQAASAIARFGDGWLVAQDDGTIAAWWRPWSISRVRLLPPVQGLDTFSEAEGTKDLKPDLEGACPVPVDASGAVLLLGSGSLDARMRGVLARPGETGCDVVHASLAPLYSGVAKALDLDMEKLNLEGACTIGGTLRWFQRGHGGSDVPSSSIDLRLAEVMAAVEGTLDPGDVAISGVRRYQFESSGGVCLAVTDAVTLPDERILVSLAAEDAPDAVADGEVVGSAIALIDDEVVCDLVHLPANEHGNVRKVEGLAVRHWGADALGVVAVIDQDDPTIPSAALELQLSL